MNESKKEMLLSAQAMVEVQHNSGDLNTKIIIMTNLGFLECELDQRIKVSEMHEDGNYTYTQLAFSINDDPGVNIGDETRIDKDCILLKDVKLHSLSTPKVSSLGSVCLSLDAVLGVSIGRLNSAQSD